jgi:hypothetical protein
VAAAFFATAARAEEKLRNLARGEAFGRQVWTLDLPGLIKSKGTSGREKDLQVLPELEGLLEAGEPD